MKPKPPSKEELLKQNAELLYKYESQSACMNRLREQFSIVLDSPQKQTNAYASTWSYDNQSHITYSWEQIFFEIGKLKALTPVHYATPLS